MKYMPAGLKAAVILWRGGLKSAGPAGIAILILGAGDLGQGNP